MAQKKISELSTASGADTSWYIMISDSSGNAYKITAEDFAALSPTSFAGTYLTWATLATDHEQWNTSMGIRRKASEANDWETNVSNVSTSTQSIATGERVGFKLPATNKTLIIALDDNTSPAALLTTEGPFGLTTDDGGGSGNVRAFESNGATAASVGTTRAGSTSEHYCIFYDGSNIRYQYSADGVTWTTFYTSLGTPSGTYRVHFTSYQSDFGPNEIYKLA